MAYTDLGETWCRLHCGSGYMSTRRSRSHLPMTYPYYELVSVSTPDTALPCQISMPGSLLSACVHGLTGQHEAHSTPTEQSAVTRVPSREFGRHDDGTLVVARSHQSALVTFKPHAQTSTLSRAGQHQMMHGRGRVAAVSCYVVSLKQFSESYRPQVYHAVPVNMLSPLSIHIRPDNTRPCGSRLAHLSRTRRLRGKTIVRNLTRASVKGDWRINWTGLKAAEPRRLAPSSRMVAPSRTRHNINSSRSSLRFCSKNHVALRVSLKAGDRAVQSICVLRHEIPAQ